MKGECMNAILKEAFAEKDYVVALRRDFHAHPELGMEEYRTADRIEEELNALGIPHERFGKTGVLATIESGKSGKTLFVRADIDALPIQEANDVPYKSQTPGIMHACGHDGHGAALLGAAKLLVRHKNELTGKVLLCFQPAEEIGGGIQPLLDSGVLKTVDRVHAIHLSSAFPVGTYTVKTGAWMASCDYFKITITGKATHGTTPDAGIDSIYIASLLVVQLQSIISRVISPVESGVVSVGHFSAGSTYNVIAGNAELEGTARTFNPESRKKIQALIAKIARNLADDYGAKAEVVFKEYTESVINNADVATEQIAAAQKLVGKDHVISEPPKRFGSDNFGNLINASGGKGSYAFVGSNGGAASAVSHHNEHFDIDEDSLVYATALHVQYALDFLG